MKKMMVVVINFLFVFNCTGNMMIRKVVSSPFAPAAIGPYSQAVRVGNFLFLSGQLGIDTKTGKLVEGGFESQARQAMENQKAILNTAGFTLEDVVQCQVFVLDLNNYSRFNEIYRDYFKADFPARAVLEVSRIPADAAVEIMMIAVKR